MANKSEIRKITLGFVTITPKALKVSYRSFSSTSCKKIYCGKSQLIQIYESTKIQVKERMRFICVCVKAQQNLTGSRFPTKRFAPTSKLFLSCDACNAKQNKTTIISKIPVTSIRNIELFEEGLKSIPYSLVLASHIT